VRYEYLWAKLQLTMAPASGRPVAASCTVVLTVPIPFIAAPVGPLGEHLPAGADSDGEECPAAAMKTATAAATNSGESLMVKAHLPIPLF
jgi:hypothetical protein